MLRLARGVVVALILGVLALWLPVSDSVSAPVAADNGTPTSGTSTACTAPAQGTRPKFTPPAHAMGKIASISAATFTVTGKNNTTSTVTTDANTRFDKVVTSSVGAIAVGDFIMVKGATPATGTIAATAITDDGKPMRPANAASRPSPAPGTTHMPPPGCKPPQRPENGNPGNRGGFAVGVVQQINGTSLVIGFPKGGKTTTVTTTSATTVTAHQKGTFADLKLGDEVAASAAPKSGTASNATAFTAAFVRDQTVH